ncbi:McrB family protein [Adlercreutzia equolifaciens]|uniref:McrB family protein n=1 Tax=Adlercreutzia equolifaciens TaxID=446660 RepID=UPI003C6C5876
MTSPNTEKLKSAILSYLSRQQGNESADKDNLTYEAVRLTLDSLGENPDDSYTVADFKLLEYLTFLKDGSNHRYAEIRQLVTESSLSDQQKIDLFALLEKGEKENVPLGFFTNSHFGKCLGSQTDETAARIIKACLEALELSRKDNLTPEEIQQLLEIPNSVANITNFGTGFMSGLFHSVCPEFFPILNKPGRQVYHPLKKEMSLIELSAKQNYVANSKRISSYLKKNFPNISSMRTVDNAQFRDEEVKRLLSEMAQDRKNPTLAEAVLEYLENTTDNPSEYNDASNPTFDLLDHMFPAFINPADNEIFKNAGLSEIELIRSACIKDISKDKRQSHCAKILDSSQLPKNQKLDLSCFFLEASNDANLGLFPERTIKRLPLEAEQAHNILLRLGMIHSASSEEDALDASRHLISVCKSIEDIDLISISALLNAISPTHFPVLDNASQTILEALADESEFDEDEKIDWSKLESYPENARRVTAFLKARGIESTRVLYNAQNDPDVRAALEAINEMVGAQSNAPDPHKTNRKERSSLNTILYGPPGTGKTYQTVTYAVSLCDPEFFAEHENDYGELFQRYEELVYEGRVVFCTFHQSYCYEEFIEGIKPVVDDSASVRYEIHSGIFKTLCDKALADEESNYLLIADEINRGNISRVFGELITLLEPSKRLGAQEERTTVLPYSGEPFGVPDNLYVLGTMNTADRSLTQIDTALRRRFEFVEVSPDPSLIEPAILETDEGAIELRLILEAMNARIGALYDRDHAIGHSYLMGVDSFAELKNRFELKIIPLLQEYFYDDYSKIRLVLNDNSDTDGFVVREGLAAQYLGNLGTIEEPLVLGRSRNWRPNHFMAIYGSAATDTASE